MRPARLLVGLLCGLGVAGGTWAPPDVARADVPPPKGCPETKDGKIVAPPAPRVRIPPDAPVTIRADRASGTPGEEVEFAGRVQLERDGQRLGAERLHYDQRTGTARASGEVMLEDAGTAQFSTSALEINPSTHIGQAAASRYRVERMQARGEAQRVEFAGPDLTRLFDVSYTTCQPGSDDWLLRIKELKLDTADDIGTAYHGTLEIGGVPVFYWPYLNFPIGQERKSGFLMPRIGVSDKRGGELEIPYYFNIAPNIDDTLTPRLLTKRGVELQNELRYLFAGTTGKLDLSYLPNDRIANDDRAAGMWRHSSAFGPSWSFNVDAQAVSDKQYLDDFGNSISTTAQTHLPQVASLNYRDPAWRFQVRALNFQTVDPALTSSDRPYMRLPQVILAHQDPAARNRLQPQLYTEFNRFADQDRLTGSRLEIQPALSLPLATSYAFLTPKAGGRYIGYSLDRDQDNQPSVALGYGSLDTGLFFDRMTQWFGKPIRQTLEPRLYYLYVPYKNQDALPVFDTALPTFTYANLFQENRFVGGDRIGDTNQITASLTTRVLDGDDGRERFRFSFGQIAYLDERRVNLPPGPIDTSRSDYVGEAYASIGQGWFAQGNLQWSADDHQTERSGVYLQYHPDRYRIINLGSRYIRNDIRQIDVSAAWPVFTNWGLLARSRYSLHDDRNIETYAGILYRSCCWGARLYWNQRYAPDENRQVNSIHFEIQLVGLGEFGRRPESPLDQGLTRYDTPPPGRNQFDP